MVAYSFKQQFIAPILAGTKRQTIRAPRKGRSRHARPGDDLQLYTAMRTKYCMLIGRATCLSTQAIQIVFEKPWVVIEHEGGGTTFIWPAGLDEFSRSDGFADWPEMCAFWAKEHPGITVFDSVLIRWIGFKAAALRGEG